MMILLRNRLTRLMVAMVMALSMTTAAFAHRLPGGDEAALEAFVLAGGNLNDLCGEGHNGPGGSCPLCRIADDLALVDAPGLAVPIRYRLVAQLHPIPDPVPAAPWHSHPVARGPPFL
ncbi:hypothetical protein HOY34_02615 [Xinfangfangia sp. D13-10-4-6]|uniref:hypothetical protein n=1 Tax=Pseudogemmobacter hezensis TaxID=2737662 RepID=UPI0015529AF3|nr:hypothetical protein [Pseudogemmobacter hezensis]NPD14089.1 hypothetical protein [Pseudogemmobacter hezensis]